MPDKQPIVIKRGAFVCTLYDVGSLLDMPLVNVRKLWALMFEAAYDNETTISVIREWLPQAVTAAKENAKSLEAELPTAKHNAEAKRRIVAAMGAALMERITNEKRVLARAKKAIKAGRLPAEKLEMYQTAYDNALRPKLDHQQAVKEVTRLDSALKTAKSTRAKAEKLHTIFTDMATKAGI